MVRKNIKFGVIENVTLIELGNGDVVVSDTVSEGDLGISFINSTPNKIGKSHAYKDKNANETGLDAIITFSNIESLEVVKDAIKVLKEKFLTPIKDN